MILKEGLQARGTRALFIVCYCLLFYCFLVISIDVCLMFDVYKRGDISMMVMRYAEGVVKYRQKITRAV